MSGHGRREQKKLAKKKAKRAERRSSLAQQSNPGLASLFQLAAQWPVVEALMPDELWERGIGNLFLARRTPDGRIAFGGYLVDVFCLGVKNAAFDLQTPSAYRQNIERIDPGGRLHSVPPESLVKLVTEAVAYARGLGFPPHSDYEIARLLFAGIDPAMSTSHFEFGKNGKPFYFQGPHESPARAATIAARVEAAGGKFALVGNGFGEIGTFADEYGEFEDAPESVER